MKLPVKKLEWVKEIINIDSEAIGKYEEDCDE
jgi:hypothetical protein